MDLTFGTEPIVAWRSWKVADFAFRGGSTEKRLAPLACGRPWLPRERAVAECTPTSGLKMRTSGRFGLHEAPWPDCTCGLWALHTRPAAEKALEPYMRREQPEPFAFGKVALWGRVLELAKGYRAQYAYPLELFMYDKGDASAEVERLYGVPVKLLAAPEVADPMGDALQLQWELMAQQMRQHLSLPSPQYTPTPTTPSSTHSTLTGYEAARQAAEQIYGIAPYNRITPKRWRWRRQVALSAPFGTTACGSPHPRG